MATFREIRKSLLEHTPSQLLHLARRKLVGQDKSLFFDGERFPCVFVLSSGRVGSDTLAHLFSLSRRAFVYHEPKPELFALSRLAYELSEEIECDPAARRAFQEGFLTARRDLFKDAIFGGRGYIETGPDVTFLASVIRDAVPAARFIHLVRAPEPFIRSGMRRHWYMGADYDRVRILPRPGSEIAARWEGMTQLQRIAWLWTETNTWILNFTAGLPPEQALLVHSEDLFQGRAETIAAMFALFGGQEPAPGRLARVLKAQHNAQTRGSFPDPSNWDDSMKAEIREITGSVAERIGYTQA